ncbi:MAG: helix-turn-helix domain-containing protein [Longimicrobiales bacterium]
MAVDLTPRERQVLELVGGGRSRREVADELDISVSTVDTYLDSLSKKLPGDGPRLRRLALLAARDPELLEDAG